MEKHKLLYPTPKENNKPLIGYVCYDNGSLKFTLRKIVGDSLVDVGMNELDPIELFDNHPLRDFIKAVIFNIDKLELPGYSNIIIYHQMIAEKLQKQNIAFEFITNHMFICTAALIISNMKLNFGEALLLIFLINGNFVISELIRKIDRYEIGDTRVIYSYNIDELKEYLSSINPKFIIAYDATQVCHIEMENLKRNILNSDKLIMLNSIESKDFPKILMAMTKRIFNSSLNQFHINRLCDETIGVIQDSNSNVLFNVNIGDKLPAIKSVILKKSTKKFITAIFNPILKQVEIIKICEPINENNSHQTKLSLIIDENNLPFLYQDPFNISEIESLPKELTSKDGLNMPVIGLFDNASVICIKSDDGVYNFLNSWNEMYGNNVYLSFDEEKPRILKTIQDAMKVKESFMVYDLLKILSMLKKDFKADEEWKFKIIKDDKNPILLEFETFNGTRKASPVFLLALILKDHIKEIKKETGKRPTELAFCVFNDFSTDEIANIKNGLEEACNLMKIKFTFLDNL